MTTHKIYESKNINVKTNKIGGKARGLIFLSKNNFRTPKFYILDFDTLTPLSKGLFTITYLVEKWQKEFNIATDSLWAVRSSAENEDGKDKSFAGFFRTVVNVPLAELENAIYTVLQSYNKISKEENASQQQSGYGIIIQQMIRSEYSGVIFSHNPLNLNEESIHINLIPGLGENLVSGKEEAFHIIHSKNKFQYQNLDKTFYGNTFTHQLNDVEKEGKLIENETKDYLNELISGTKKLYRLKKYPVDIEFTIAKGVIYWLQIRPITTKKEETIVWDNTSCESNYPGITMPLSISMVTNSTYRVYKNMALFLGMPKSILNKNEPLLKNMSGEINGRLYYNVTAWQKLIYQLPFGKRASKALPEIWGMKPAEFAPENYSPGALIKLKLFSKLIISFFFFNKLKRNYNSLFKKVHSHYENIDLNTKSHSELIGIYTDVENKLGGNWESPMLNGFFTILFFSSLKKILKHSRLHTKYPNFINDILFSQNDVISLVIINEFQSILFQISNDPIKKELFINIDVDKIIFQLVNKHQEFYSSINNYIYKYGDRSEEGELKIETINYKEDPRLFISFLKSCTHEKMDIKRQKINFNYKEALKKEYRFNIIKRIILRLLIKQTIKRVRDRENFRFMRTVSFGLVRKILRAIDKQLLKEKLVLERGDSLYLLMPEIMNLDLRQQYIDIISNRKEAYKKHTFTEVHSRYTQTGKEKNPDNSSDVIDGDSVIKGIGCSSGIIKGEVKLVEDNTTSESCSGKILVANYFEPGKLNLFSQAAGIISIRGNLLSHTAILCREMGIPAIVSAKGLLQKVKDGDIIEMNGATGIIILHLNE